MDIGCDVKDGHCRRAVHAEFNAVVEAEEQWRPTGNSTIYVYDSQYRGVCCNACEVEVSGAGIIRTLFYPN
jgi:deoxycytidylate deaminase